MREQILVLESEKSKILEMYERSGNIVHEIAIPEDSAIPDTPKPVSTMGELPSERRKRLTEKYKKLRAEEKKREKEQTDEHVS